MLTLVLLFVAGIFGGLYAAAVGGGGLLTLPLMLLIGVPPHVALGTQRLAAVMFELSSSIKFYTSKKFNLKLALGLGFFSIVGALFGVSALIKINETVLTPLVALILLFSVVVLLVHERLGVKPHPLTKNNLYLLVPASVLLGFYGGFFGPGFGVVSVILLTLFGFTFIESAAVSRVIRFMTSVATAIVFAIHGYIDYTLGITLGAGFAIGSWIGVGAALKRGERHIKLLLILITAATIVKVVFDYLG